MASISSVVTQTSTYEPYVKQLVEIESQKKLQLEVQLDDNKEARTALSAVSTSITDFENIIKELENPANSSFEPFSTSSSDESVIKVNSASGIPRESDYKITIDRLAKADVQLDQVRTAADTNLSAFGDGSLTITIGAKTETINVLSTKDDGSGGTIAMTNEEILQAFANEIETVFGEEAQANVFNTNGTDIQFSLQSLTTGFDNRVQISGGTGVLAEISSSMTRLNPEAELDAQFTVDGVTFQRSSNTVDDAIDGLSFTLLKESTSQETMSVRRNVDEAKSNINDFIKKFNEMNSTIRERTFINGETGNKGPLQGMRTVRNLSNNMRQLSMQSVSGVSSSEVSTFAQMGISFGNDGEMKIDDADLLDDILRNRPDEIANFFTSDSSPVAAMKNLAESFTQEDGIMSSLKDGVDQKIERLDQRITKETTFLEEYEAEQRRIFNELDLIIEQGQAQFDQIFTSLSIY